MKNSFITKKIVAGKFKNKVLKLPSKSTTRSSKAIVLESFFNTIQFEIIDAIFVELFSGSGSIGLEALSRGAKEIIFMERDREALKILRENIAQTDPSLCEVYVKSFKYKQYYKRDDKNKTCAKADAGLEFFTGVKQ